MHTLLSLFGVRLVFNLSSIYTAPRDRLPGHAYRNCCVAGHSFRYRRLTSMNFDGRLVGSSDIGTR